MTKQLRKAALAAALVALAGTAQAELRTVAPGQAAVITFDDAASYDTSVAAVQIGASVGLDVTVSAVGGTLQFGAPLGAWALGPTDDMGNTTGNGEWTGSSFVGVDGDFQDATNEIAASLIVNLAVPKATVGAFVNFDPTFSYGGGLPLPLYIAAYDTSGTLLEDHFVPVWTPGGLNAGSFYGITLASDSIARFEVSGPYAVMDTLTIAAVPESGALAMLLAGLGVIGSVAGRRPRRA